MKKFALVLTVLLILILSAACGQQNPADGAPTTAEPPTVDRQRKASDMADKVKAEFSDKVFGGIYIDDGKVYVNLTEDEFKKLANTEEERDGVKINYKPVKFSLETLPAATDSIFERLNSSENKYDIVTADANDVTNKVDIEVRPLRDEVYEIASEYIDLEYVNITELPEDYSLEFTPAEKLPE